MRLAAKDLLILYILAHHGAMFGLDIVKQSHNRIGRGAVYVRLSRLIDKSLVFETVRDDFNRAKFDLTSNGRDFLA